MKIHKQKTGSEGNLVTMAYRTLVEYRELSEMRLKHDIKSTHIYQSYIFQGQSLETSRAIFQWQHKLMLA